MPDDDPTPPPEPPPDDPAGEVTRTVDIDAPPADVWELIADPERRATWLDDEDARARVTEIEQIDTGRHLSWRWWHPGDGRPASRVAITLDETPAGCTRVVVTERRLDRPAHTARHPRARACAGVAGGTGSAVAPVARAWELRLLGLELLLLVGAGTPAPTH